VSGRTTKGVFTLCACPQQCGRPATRKGLPGELYYEACFRRWHNAGRPDTGPPPPLSRKECVARMQAARQEQPELPFEEWAEVAPALRRARVLPSAVELARMVRVGDQHGLEVLLGKPLDWEALAITLAWCADPERLAVLLEQQRARVA
jgi:hypothetical protein